MNKIKENLQVKKPTSPGTPKELDVQGTAYNSSTGKAVQDRYQWIEDRIKHLNETNNLVVIVMFIAVAALLLTVFGLVIQHFDEDRASQEQTQKVIQNLQDKNQDLKIFITWVPVVV